MARIDELRLMTKVARMYYESNMRQTEIMDRLNVSQSTVSRLLKRAEIEGIIRITVTAPSGTHPELEETLQSTYELKDAIVVDSVDDEEQIVRDIGAAAAFYIETTIKAGDVVGISSRSAALLAMVNAMQPGQRAAGSKVVQILGGIGNPGAEVHATHLTRRLANLIGAEPTLLPAPGVVGTPKARDVLMKDQFVQQAIGKFRSVTVALVGVGAVDSARMQADAGTVFTAEELKLLAAKGAVGDICLRFFDEEGRPVSTGLSQRVIGMDVDELRRVDRVVAVAGGKRKLPALRGALAGRWIDVLITNRAAAEQLLEDTGGQRRLRSRAAS